MLHNLQPLGSLPYLGSALHPRHAEEGWPSDLPVVRVEDAPLNLGE